MLGRKMSTNLDHHSLLQSDYVEEITDQEGGETEQVDTGKYGQPYHI